MCRCTVTIICFRSSAFTLRKFFVNYHAYISYWTCSSYSNFTYINIYLNFRFIRLFESYILYFLHDERSKFIFGQLSNGGMSYLVTASGFSFVLPLYRMAVSFTKTVYAPRHPALWYLSFMYKLKEVFPALNLEVHLWWPILFIGCTGYSSSRNINDVQWSTVSKAFCISTTFLLLSVSLLISLITFVIVARVPELFWNPNWYLSNPPIAFLKDNNLVLKNFSERGGLVISHLFYYLLLYV